jgi:hypothetical protein
MSYDFYILKNSSRKQTKMMKLITGCEKLRGISEMLRTAHVKY